MSLRDFYPFYPRRILWTGAAVLSGGVAIGVAFLVFLFDAPSFVCTTASAKREEVGNQEKPLSFSLGLKEAPIAFPLPRLEPEMTFSFDPPKPNGSGRNEGLVVRFKQSAESQRVSLPCRIDLQFNGGKLAKAPQASPLWLELTGGAEEGVKGVVWIESESFGKVEAERFIASPQASPLREIQEFAEGTPFRILAGARSLGHDMFAEKYEGKQTVRIAMGAEPQIIDFQENDWIVWDGVSWGKGSLQKASAVARIESAGSEALILEGWDDETYVRLSLPISLPPPFKVKGEEIFNSIRVRSEKQISCMMEKQCLILRSGDWVLKTNGRWKTLRKKEEKGAYRSGKIRGELFIFEKIESKQNQKFVSGFLFNAERSQVIPIYLAANKHPTRQKG